MSATAEEPPPGVLVHRPEAAQDIGAVIKGIVADETNRRRWHVLLAVVPWLISFVFGAYALGAGYVMAHRPVPQPRIDLAIYRSDGTLEAPRRFDDLTEDRRLFALRSDLQNFIIAWESYNWRTNQSYYNHVSAMTAGQPLQARYQESWHRPGDPDNRETKYGRETTRDVAMIRSSFVPDAPLTLVARTLVKTVTPTGASCEWWQSNLTFKPDNGTIPQDLKLAYDPTGSIVVSYVSTPADPSAKPFAC